MAFKSFLPLAWMALIAAADETDAQQVKVQWNQFRGPNGQGVVEGGRIPVHFGPESNVAWKTNVPPGHSSPVIWDDLIFLTACEAAEAKELVTLAIDRNDGKVLWRQVVPAGAPARLHPLNHPASSTPAADERYVVSCFGTYGLLCYDHAGREVWQRKLDMPASRYGPATSPIVYRDKVILVLDGDGGSSRMLAVHRDTGETAWERPRPLFGAGWSTPVIFHHDEVDELVVLGSRRLTSYDPATGEEVWWSGGFPDETVGVPVTGDGLLFAGAAALGGRGDDKLDAAATWKTTVEEFDRNRDRQIGREEMTEGFAFIERPELPRDNPGYGLPVRDMDVLLAIFDHDKNGSITEGEWMGTMAGFAAMSRPHLAAFRPGAKGDARDRVVWESHRGIPETPSMLHVRGRLYLLRDGGVLTCLKAPTGEELFRERIGAPGQYLASPVAAGDKIVAASVPGIITVLQAGDGLKVLARNEFGERIFATPAIAEGRIYLRTEGHLYALGQGEELLEFLDCRLVPRLGNAWDYTFEPGKFPQIEWERPELVEKVMGSFPLKVRWFDGDGREVASPDRPGRYAFYTEGTTPGGKTIRRAATLYCRPKDWFGWSEKPKAYLDFLPLDGLERSAWDEHREAIAGFAGRTVLLSILRQSEGAVLLSYLHELKCTGAALAPTDTPLIRDHDYHLALKRKILGLENRFPPFRPPRRVKGKPAPVLREGAETEAGFKPGTAEKLREICREWFERSREPFHLVVARRGVVILDAPFGSWEWGPMTRETPTEMASLTKLVTGVLFAQFVDQGLVGIDDPVGKYFPDFPVAGENALTLRHCFTHATALDGHEEWGGMHNPWLENVIANAGEHLLPGRVHNYSGMGYDLAGKVMEIVGGKSIFRLLRENLFDPLEMSLTSLEEDLGFGCHSTAGDFARIGQLLLNRGAYGELEFFSQQTFDTLLPQPLSRYFPAIDREWGIGITWMRQSHPRAGTDGIPEGRTVLSRNVIGHGSATSAILRVDLDHDLVIAQTRRRGGANYDEHVTKLLLAIEEGLLP